jgi:hypothetical protein
MGRPARRDQTVRFPTAMKGRYDSHEGKAQSPFAGDAGLA